MNFGAGVEGVDVDLDDFGDVLGVAAGEDPGYGDFVVPAEAEDSEVAGFEIGLGEVERRGGYRGGLGEEKGFKLDKFVCLLETGDCPGSLSRLIPVFIHPSPE